MLTVALLIARVFLGRSSTATKRLGQRPGYDDRAAMDGLLRRKSSRAWDCRSYINRPWNFRRSHSGKNLELFVRFLFNAVLAMARIDSDTRVPVDCLLYGALETHESPEVSILQHGSWVMQFVISKWRRSILGLRYGNWQVPKHESSALDTTQYTGPNGELDGFPPSV